VVHVGNLVQAHHSNPFNFVRQEITKCVQGHHKNPLQTKGELQSPSSGLVAFSEGELGTRACSQTLVAQGRGVAPEPMYVVSSHWPFQ